MVNEEQFEHQLKLTFLEELEEVLDSIEKAFLRFESTPDNTDLLNEIFRYFHNVKGSSKTVGLLDLADFAHNAENLLTKLRTGEMSANQEIIDCLLGTTDLIRDFAEQIHSGEGTSDQLMAHSQKIARLIEGVPAEEEFINFSEVSPASEAPASPEKPGNRPDGPPKPPVKKMVHSEENIRLPLSRIDSLLDHFGEQVILQSSLDYMMAEEAPPDREFLNKTVNSLKKITQNLQHTMVTLRMVPLNGVFQRMERAIRDISRQTGKKINFVKDGESAELDKNIADALVEWKAVCHCGRKATMNLRVSEDGSAVTEGAQTEIGGNDRYVALCRKHFSASLRGDC